MGVTSGAGSAHLSGAHEFTPGFSGVRVTRSLALCVCFVDRCLSIFVWSLCCLFFVDIRILITTLVSSNSS
jgi:hypothetical protein